MMSTPYKQQQKMLVMFVYIQIVLMEQINTKQSVDYTLVVFGINSNNVNVLVPLLSDDGHLAVEVRDDMVIVSNPDNNAWQPDPKYIICHATSSAGIDKFLAKLNEPFRFIVAFDVGDMFVDPFWVMMNHLTKRKSANDELKMVAMNIPHDKITLKQHFDELKSEIQNGLQNHSVDFEMLGMHVIEKSGPVREMPELQSETEAIKLAVDQRCHKT